MTRKIGLAFVVLAVLLSSFVGMQRTRDAAQPTSPTQRQSTPDFGTYPFIRQDKNRIFAADAEAMRHFYASLDSLAGRTKANVNIIHIGDSHVQGDFFSGHLREMLQADTSFGNGGRGLVFPYNAARTNGPFNVKVTHSGGWEGCRSVARYRDCNWGLAGITATTLNADAILEIDPNVNSALRYPVSRFRIFFEVEDATNFQVAVLNPEGIRSEKIGEGYIEFELQKPVESLRIGFRKTASQNHFTLQGIALENGQPGIRYHSAGVNGADVASVVKMPSLEKDLKALKPDLVIVSLGTNDAYVRLDAKTFKRTYGELIQRIRRASPTTSVLLTTPGDNLRRRRYLNPDNSKAVKRITELAEETGAATWDFYGVMGGLQSIRKWRANRLAAPDYVHLTQHGYALQAELLHDALMDGYGTHSIKNSGR